MSFSTLFSPTSTEFHFLIFFPPLFPPRFFSFWQPPQTTFFPLSRCQSHPQTTPLHDNPMFLCSSRPPQKCPSQWFIFCPLRKRIYTCDSLSLDLFPSISVFLSFFLEINPTPHLAAVLYHHYPPSLCGLLFFSWVLRCG